NAAARVVHLRHVRSDVGASRLTVEVEAHAGELGFGKALAPIGGRKLRQRFGVVAFIDPLRAQSGQTRANVDAAFGIRIRTRRVVNDERRIRLGAERCRRVGLHDLAHGHADVGPRTRDMDLALAYAKANKLARRRNDYNCTSLSSVIERSPWPTTAICVTRHCIETRSCL